MVWLLFDSTATTGDVTVPDVVDTRAALKLVVLSVIGSLKVTVRTPFGVIVPGTWFDAEVAKNVATAPMLMTCVVESVPMMNALAVEVVCSSSPWKFSASATAM